MKNLINAITAQEKQRLNEFIKTVNKEKDLTGWRYADLIPKGKDVSDWTLKEKKAYLIKRKEAKIYKEIEREVKGIKSVFASGEFIGAKISVEWKKSRMWGSNPTAECWATFKDKSGQNSLYVKSGSISGCGYDKLSTAVAEALNQVGPVLKALYKLKDKNIDKNNRDLFGYGSGYGVLPRLEGGVGVSCYPEIFKTIGYKFESIASGKSFDVFQITKL